MQKLHDDIRRLSNEVTNEIDDISRYISVQYMKKKSLDIKMRRESMLSGNSQGTPTLAQPAETQQQQPSGRNLASRNGFSKEDYLNSELFNSHSMIHNYGKIESGEKNFENLSKNQEQKSTLNEQSKGQNYQPL